MSETVPEDIQSRICPILFAYRNSMARFGAPSSVGEDTMCAVTCVGIKTEARAIGGVTLPHVFDRVYCENTQ